MSDQPTALRLADALNALAERFSAGWHDGIKIDATDIVDNAEAAEELRRLHEVKQELLEALLAIIAANSRDDGPKSSHTCSRRGSREWEAAQLAAYQKAATAIDAARNKP